jgi:hypothetical protein
MGRTGGYVATAVLGGILATAALAQRAERVAPVTEAQATRWEYATLRFKFLSGKWEWLSGDKSLTAAKEELYRSLGGTHAPQGRDVSYIDVANQASAQGWEMLTLIERDTGTEIVFKRAVR